MAPVQLKLRKAMGVVKDQTSIQIAKVAGTPDLDVALVKATSHDEFPTEEKHMQELLHFISYSRGYSNAAIAGLSKRLSKTRNWIVALKSLMVIHRLLRDGDPLFEQEINQAGRYGIRILNMSGFRDDSQSSDAWDYSAFVRTYSLFLDERLDCLSSSGGDKKGNSNRRSPRNRFDDRRNSWDERRAGSYDDRRGGSYEDRRGSYEDRRGSYGDDRKSTYDDWRSPRREERRQGSYGGDNDDEKEDSNGDSTPIKEMNAELLLEKLPRLQRLLDRVLGCRPTGAARINRLIQIAMYAVVTESFQLHTDMSDGIARLRDGFSELEQPAAVKAFDIIKRAEKQLRELANLYGVCKDVGVGRTSEYPTVTRITPDQLDELEDRLRDGRSALVVVPIPEPEPMPRSPSPERTYEDTMEMKALPAPPVVEPEPEPEPEPPVETEGDLLNLSEDALTSEQEEDKLALALFSSGAKGNGNWESFAPGDRRDRPGMPSFSETGKEGWELALVASASNLAQAKGETLAGGFNPLLLDSMYEQAEARKAVNIIPSGSESSVASTGGSRPSSNVLALPAPQSVAMPGQDPFAASAVVPPPPYVQMADVLKKQQLLNQEQQMWQQYQSEGMRGYYSMMNVHNQNHQPQAQLALPYYNQGMHRQFSYY